MSLTTVIDKRLHALMFLLIVLLIRPWL